VWKVTALYGAEFRLNHCVNFHPNSTHEIGTKMRCIFNNDASGRFSYHISAFLVNEIAIVSSISGFPTNASFQIWGSTNCGSDLWGSYNRDWSCVNSESDPNILPIWLPANTTLQSGGPNTFVSVIEFNIIP